MLVMAAIMMILALTMTAISRVKIALKIRQQYNRDSIFKDSSSEKLTVVIIVHNPIRHLVCCNK